jgi:hypothetical protein
MQEDTIIYTDKEMTKPLSSTSTINNDTTYYYKSTYYQGNEIVEEAVARTGSELKDMEITKKNGSYIVEAGSPKPYELLEFEGDKANNQSNTAESYYSVIFNHSSNESENDVQVYLGNNGTLDVSGGGQIKISKTVDVSEGYSPSSDTEFTFQLDLDSQTDTAYPYYILLDRNGNTMKDSNGNVITETITHSGTLKLKAGQSAIIANLPEVGYTITEVNIPTGYKATQESLTGTVETNQTKEASFTNTYEPTPLTVSDALTGLKSLKNTSWQKKIMNLLLKSLQKIMLQNLLNLLLH